MAGSLKVDFKQIYRDLYSPSAREPEIVEVPRLKFLMIDGSGDPNGEEFQHAVEALYGLSYGLKFYPKKHGAPEGYYDYGVPPLEALWWVAGNQPYAFDRPRDEWRWTAMIPQPDFITIDLVDAVRADAAAKKPNPSLAKVRLDEFEEGQAVQMMHIGPYETEWLTLAHMMEYMTQHGVVADGKHHEIYLGDPRRTDPAKLKTILRHPVRAGD